MLQIMAMGSPSRNGLTHFMGAIKSGDISTVVAVLNSNSQVYINRKDELGLTPQIWSTILGLNDVATTLLNAGANPDVKEVSSGNTALMVAAEKGHVSVVAALLRAKDNPDIKYNERGILL